MRRHPHVAVLAVLLATVALSIPLAAVAASAGHDPASPTPATLRVGERLPSGGGPKAAPSGQGVPVAGPGPTASAPAGRSTEDVLMQEGFEGGWPAPGGLWVTYDYDPATNGEYYWNDVDNSCNPSTGDRAAWPAAGGANALGPCSDGHYANNMDSWMVYGPFDLRPYSSAHLEFWYWNQSELNWDWLFWGASEDGSFFDGEKVSGSSSGWQHVDFALTDYLGQDEVWVALYFESDASNVGIGPYVDEVALSGAGVFPLPFAPVFPANGATSVPVNTSLSWSDSHYATGYEYCLDTADDNYCGVPWVEVPSNYTPRLSLEYSTTYYWTPRSHNDFGYRWTDWWSFSTPVGNDEPGSAVTIGSLPFYRDEAVGTASGALLDPSLNCAGPSQGHNTVWFMYTATDRVPLSVSSLGSDYDTVLGVFIGAPGALHEWACSDDYGGPQSKLSFMAQAGTTYYIEVASKAALTAGGLSLYVTSPTVHEGELRAVGSFDGWVLEQDEASGKGGSMDAAAATLRVGDDASDRQYRVILDFDTSSLPDDAVVVGLTLRVKRQGVTGKNPILTHGLLKVDMRTGFFHDIQALERFDFQAPGSRGNVGRFIRVMDPGDWYRAPLRAPSYERINLTGTTQFRLRFDLDDNDNGRADYLSLLSGNVGSAADRPQLIVEYYLP